MTRPLLTVLALALALAPSAAAGQDSTTTVPNGACASGDPMPVVVPPESGAALPAPEPRGAPPVPIPNACSGRTSGIVRIHGTRAVGTEPLYVVDGVIQPKAENGDSPLESILPQSIEAITVLKDRTGTTRYGPQAQHGVVIIQTKKAPAVPAQP